MNNWIQARHIFEQFASCWLRQHLLCNIKSAPAKIITNGPSYIAKKLHHLIQCYQNGEYILPTIFDFGIYWTIMMENNSEMVSHKISSSFPEQISVYFTCCCHHHDLCWLKVWNMRLRCTTRFAKNKQILC